MKKTVVIMVSLAVLLLTPLSVSAQYKDRQSADQTPKTETDILLEQAQSAEKPVVITLEQALEIALSENVAVKVADLEIKRTQYAKKGAYAALYPQIDLSAAYQRTIKRQVMYMDIDSEKMAGMMGGGSSSATDALAGIMQRIAALEAAAGIPTPPPAIPSVPESGATEDSGASLADGMEVGLLNTLNGGVTVAMPLINAQL